VSSSSELWSVKLIAVDDKRFEIAVQPQSTKQAISSIIDLVAYVGTSDIKRHFFIYLSVKEASQN
jgi:hypothetical protein